MMKINTLIQQLNDFLKTHSATPRLDAEILLCHVLDKPRSFLYTDPDYVLSQQLDAELQALIQRRARGEPIAYIVERQEFWSLEFTVTPDTLIPRPETEHLIEWVLSQLPTSPLRVADLGTGSGAIAIALGHERPMWEIHATDISAAALQVAIQNADNYRLNNIAFYLGSWCDALPEDTYHAIISNPPYISENDPHLDALFFEPMQALVAKDNGLAAIQQIITEATNKLAPGGLLVIEHGYNQAVAVQALLKTAGFRHITSYQDLGNQTRFTVSRSN